MLLNQFLVLAAFLFCVGIYGVLARKNAVLVLMCMVGIQRPDYPSEVAARLSARACGGGKLQPRSGTGFA